MGLIGFDGSVEPRSIHIQNLGQREEIHDAIHTLAKVQSRDGDRWNYRYWFVGVDLLYPRTAIEGRHGDSL
jgi:hypothetical protein